MDDDKGTEDVSFSGPGSFGDDRHSVFERLRRTRDLLAESQRSAHVGSWEWDVRTGELTWSDELYRIYGLDPEHDRIDFERYQERLHPDDRALVRETVERALGDARPFAFDHRIVRPDGEQRTLHGRGRAITGEDGSVVRMIGSAQDITERKRREDGFRFLSRAGHLLASSLDYEETLRRISELAVPYMADWAVVDIVEPGGIRRLAVHHSDPAKVAMARELAERWPPDLDAPRGVPQVIRSGEPTLLPDIPDDVIDESARSPEHAEAIRGLGLRSALLVPMIARDRVLGVITFVAAESGRTYGNEDLELAQALAERAAMAVDSARLYRDAREAARARDEVVAMVSHDLRNPLNAVLAGASLLLEVPLSEEEREGKLKAILRAAERMERLTRDLLDVTRIEAGELHLDIVPLDPRDLIDEALASCKDMAGRTGLFVTAEVEDDLPRIRADRDRILQVLDNLLSNAVRHTPEGGRVTIRAAPCPEGLRVAVIDTGEGIPPDILPDIFNRFSQGEGAAQGSAGLGLPIARGIVEAHGGTLWVESEPGQGSSFFFVLPVGRSEAVA